MVSGAVAGDDLKIVAGSASEALGRPTVIALPDELDASTLAQPKKEGDERCP